MGTQFSKIKVTQRVELHGDVFDHADGHYDTEELPDLFTRRAHHAGVLSGQRLSDKLYFHFLQLCDKLGFLLWLPRAMFLGIYELSLNLFC